MKNLSDNDIIEFWKNNSVFEKSIQKSSKKDYVFYDGPPFANGLPHYGHLLTGFVKDVFARYHTMIMEKVNRTFGWDCHGLPVEMEVEKELKIHGKKQIKDYGIDKFNETCQQSAMRYASNWKEYVEKQGRFVDFDKSYKTMDKSYMESVIWAFKKLYDKGLIKEDYRVMPYSWKCESTVSNFETQIDNCYRKKESKSVYVKFKLTDCPDFLKSKNPENLPCFLVVWTTTPWTLPANLAIAINPKITYQAIEKDREILIFAKSCSEKILSLLVDKPK